MLNDRLPPAPVSRSHTLAWALVASVIVHGAFIALRPGASGPMGSSGAPAAALQATLVDARQVENAAVAVTTVPSSTLALPAEVSPAPAPAESTARTRGRSGLGASAARYSDVWIRAHPLSDRDRLGDLGDRQLREFPVEIDYPPRLAQPISVPYPSLALAEGREDVVTVWIVVNAEGRADEITVVQGTEEFATGVVAALREARFLSARNHLVAIAFPVALEFRFTLDGIKSSGATATARSQ